MNIASKWKLWFGLTLAAVALPGSQAAGADELVSKSRSALQQLVAQNPAAAACKAKAAKLRIDTRFGNSQSADLAADLRANQQGKVILICWRHPYIPALLGALGATPKTFLPNGKWPGSVYNWVIQLSFDQDGHLIPSSSRRIDEHLMPGGSQ